MTSSGIKKLLRYSLLTLTACGSGAAGVSLGDAKSDAPDTSNSADTNIVVAIDSSGGIDVSKSDSSAGDGACNSGVTCDSKGATCGQIPDGCGGTLTCGTCDTGLCMGDPPVCVVSSGDAAVGDSCVSTDTCDSLGYSCGQAVDSCGNILDCWPDGGTCPAGSSCTGTPATCVTQDVATCKTSCDPGFNCGVQADGCGGTVTCGSSGGTCTTGQTCIANVCTAPVCTPKTAATCAVGSGGAGTAGSQCGSVSDGCGGLIQCGSCNEPTTCGGGGATPSVCSIPASCTGLCQQQTSCPAGSSQATTTISGKVYAPNGTDPLYNVLVYVPNGGTAANNYGVKPFPAGVSCDSCTSTVTGSPLVSTVTDVNGAFTLSDVPVGSSIPLVIQTGRWRKLVTIPTVTACKNTAVSATLTSLPSTQPTDGIGNIPKMAFATGSVDALECVLKKIGVSTTEFTGYKGSGRINLFVGISDTNTGAAGGANAPNDTTSESTLLTIIDNYDMVLLPCKGEVVNAIDTNPVTSDQKIVINYANAGGRVFATHYSYNWLYNDTPFSGTATWNPNGAGPANQNGTINTGFPKGAALAQWLVNVGASTTLGQIPIQVLRNDVQGVVSPTQEWIEVPNPDYNKNGKASKADANTIMHMTFNTPIGAAADAQCGRVLFDDFHVEDREAASGVYAPTTGKTFPAECDTVAMTAQERLLEFMIFDLGSCVTPDVPVCTKVSCASQNIGCGLASDGCGGSQDCGTCPTGQTCGGGGVPNQCGAPVCTPTSCPTNACSNSQTSGCYCGSISDGCGSSVNCGTCPGGQTCGGAGPNLCGSTACTPTGTCPANACSNNGQAAGCSCAEVSDGCGSTISCGSCPTGQACGGGGMPGVCGTPTCTPSKSCPANACNVQSSASCYCGSLSDGCGNVLNCGTCPTGTTCGGGGVNTCGTGTVVQ